MAKIGQDRVAELTALVKAIEGGGFSSAARALGVTPSAISKTITRLEARLGVRLLNRTTRRLTPTPEGDAFCARGRRILSEIDEAEQEVTRFRTTPRGLLRMHTLVAFGLHQLPPVIDEFLQRFPEMKLELSISDRLADLIEEGADMAVRTGIPRDSSLVARPICDTHRVICAAPSYLARHGMPCTPDDLLQHNCLYISTQPALRRWPFNDDAAPGGVRMIEVGGSVIADNAETVLQLALNGVGIVRLGELVVGEPIRAGQLVPVLTDVHHVEPLPLYAVYPQARVRSPKVAAMVDFLIEKFAHAPWRFAARKPPGLARKRRR
ncbi:MAG: LysR family transcriptional regulator [Gemmatimonadota bacterium]